MNTDAKTPARRRRIRLRPVVRHERRDFKLLFVVGIRSANPIMGGAGGPRRPFECTDLYVAKRRGYSNPAWALYARDWERTLHLLVAASSPRICRRLAADLLNGGPPSDPATDAQRLSIALRNVLRTTAANELGRLT